MIIGIGSDIIENARIAAILQKQDEHFLNKIFTEDERKAAEHKASRRGGVVGYYAKRFAAKEACAKALGVGIGEHAFWHDITVFNAPSGKPGIKLSGKALEQLHSLLPPGMTAVIDVSLSDCDTFSLAFVVISAVKNL